MSEPELCPNCGERLRSAFSSNPVISEAAADLINLHVDNPSEAYCGRCAEPLIAEIRARRVKEKQNLIRSIQQYVDTIPVASIHSPAGWTYEVIGLITAQSTLGTGLFSDVSSMFTDIFGQQSETYNSKLRQGEEHCARILRTRAMEVGGNAVLAADIDYAEVGGTRAMLMVCMTGTAVRLDTDETSDERYSEAKAALDRLQLISQLEKAALASF